VPVLALFRGDTAPPLPQVLCKRSPVDKIIAGPFVTASVLRADVRKLTLRLSARAFIPGVGILNISVNDAPGNFFILQTDAFNMVYSVIAR
jgi:hypothetical protein